MGCNASCAKKAPREGSAEGDDSVQTATSAALLREVSWKDDKAGKISHAQFVATGSGRLEDSFQAMDKGRLLGEGAFGSVFKAKCLTTGVTRAVKAIKKEKLHMSFLTHEVGIMREMDHPNIVKLFAVFEDKRIVHLVMELCAGGELFDAIISEGSLSEAKAAMLMQQVLRGICYMHEQYVAHRDIKAENFLFLRKGPIEGNFLKLTDFGLSKRCEPGATMNEVAGTPDFVAPEVLKGEYTLSCDIWSTGVLHYVMICGYPPFAGHNDEELLENVKKGKVVYRTDDWRHVSSDCRDIIRQQLQLNPERRITAKEALAHVWIAQQAPQATAESLSNFAFIENLRSFHSHNKLKKAAVHAVAGQLGEEQISELRELFVALDKDGDGQLTGSEIKSGLQGASLKVPPDLQKVLEAVDSDGSGVIDYTEFLAAALDRRVYAQEDLCWSAFKLFDKDGDGSISKEEVRAILGEGGLAEGMGFDDVDQVMREVDTNGDGEIDFEEFMTMMRKAAPTRSQASGSIRGRTEGDRDSRHSASPPCSPGLPGAEPAAKHTKAKPAAEQKLGLATLAGVCCGGSGGLSRRGR